MFDKFSIRKPAGRLQAGWAALALLCGVAGAGSSTAQAQMSADAVKQQVAKQFGVTVLKIEAVTDDGKPAFAVTMMNPGGSFNEAFQVNTVVVDAATGQPVLQYRAMRSGTHHAAPAVTERTSPNTATTP